MAGHPRRPGEKQPKTRNLVEHLRAGEADVLRFAHDLTVPFSNNQAERDLRPSKTQMKISGTFRSEESATAWARIRDYISAALKHGVNAFDAIHTVITGKPLDTNTFTSQANSYNQGKVNPISVIALPSEPLSLNSGNLTKSEPRRSRKLPRDIASKSR